MIAVPVAIVGTFAVMAAVGFSLNNISLFGLVLAIGIVVDDAIVVVENVERWLEQGLPPREAARKAMDEVTGPVIAVALVLCAVFVPCAFISGITGQFFRQFAVTIAVSTVFSAINSLTLSPALAAILLRPHGGRRDPLTWLLDMSLGWFFRLFNAGFRRRHRRLRLDRGPAAARQRAGAAGLRRPAGADRTGCSSGARPASSRSRTRAGSSSTCSCPTRRRCSAPRTAMAQIDKIARETPGVAHTITVAGMSLRAVGQQLQLRLDVRHPRAVRRSGEVPSCAPTRSWPGCGSECGRAGQGRRGRRVRRAADPRPERGRRLQAHGRGPRRPGAADLAAADRRTWSASCRQDPTLVGVSTQFRSNTPQLYMDIDRTKVASLGVSLNDVNQTLQIYLGSLYVNSFNDFGRHWQVNVQAEGKFRNRVDDINLLKVRNNQGQMVPLGTLVNVREIGGPIMVTRYNLYTAAPITGNLRPGVSSGEAIAAIDDAGRRDAAAAR